MESRVYYGILYDFYGGLLTEKQQHYFEDYYFQNLTLSELSENYGVSRNAIHKQLKETTEKLEHYECILKLNEKKEAFVKAIAELSKEDQTKLLKIME